MGNISGDCSECCCHLSAAHTVTLPKARGIFLQHRQEKRFERPGRAAGREGCGEGQELKILAKRRNSDIRSCPKATSRSCELTVSRADEGDNLGLVGFFFTHPCLLLPSGARARTQLGCIKKSLFGELEHPIRLLLLSFTSVFFRAHALTVPRTGAGRWRDGFWCISLRPGAELGPFELRAQVGFTSWNVSSVGGL